MRGGSVSRLENIPLRRFGTAISRNPSGAAGTAALMMHWSPLPAVRGGTFEIRRSDAVGPSHESTSMPVYRSRTTTHGRNMAGARGLWRATGMRSEEQTSELQSLLRISYAVFCLKKKKTTNLNRTHNHTQHTRTQ